MGNSLRDQLSEISEDMSKRDQFSKLIHIFGDYVTNFKSYTLSIKEMEDAVYKEAFEWLEKSFPNSKKLLSKKNRFRLAGRKFMIHIKEKRTYILAKIINAESLKRMTMTCATITPMSTEKGLLYFLTDRGNNSVRDKEFIVTTAITSHVFDRYSERAYDNELSRLETISAYYYDQLPGWVLKGDGTYMKPSKKGIALGEFIMLPFTKLSIFLLLEKTFVSSDMVRPDQNDSIIDSLYNFRYGDINESNDCIYLP